MFEPLNTCCCGLFAISNINLSAMQSEWWGYTQRKRCRCGMLPIHVVNIIIICNIVSILTIFFAKNFVFCTRLFHLERVPHKFQGNALYSIVVQSASRIDCTIRLSSSLLGRYS